MYFSSFSKSLSFLREKIWILKIFFSPKRSKLCRKSKRIKSLYSLVRTFCLMMFSESLYFLRNKFKNGCIKIQIQHRDDVISRRGARFSTSKQVALCIPCKSEKRSIVQPQWSIKFNFLYRLLQNLWKFTQNEEYACNKNIYFLT